VAIWSTAATPISAATEGFELNVMVSTAGTRPVAEILSSTLGTTPAAMERAIAGPRRYAAEALSWIESTG